MGKDRHEINIKIDKAGLFVIDKKMVTQLSLLKSDDMQFVEEVVALSSKMIKMEKVINMYEVWAHDTKVDIFIWKT